IRVTADAVLLDGGVAFDDSSVSTGIFSITSGTDPGSGSGASITIVAEQLALHNGANVLARTLGAGPGGSLDVKINGPLTIDSGASIATTTSGDGNGNAGNVTVSASALTITNFGSVTSAVLTTTNEEGIVTSQIEGGGNPGYVTVTAGEVSIVNGGV